MYSFCPVRTCTCVLPLLEFVAVALPLSLFVSPRTCFIHPCNTPPRLVQVYISSTKSMMGHTLGAAGGLEAIVCAQVLRHGEIPPTKNLENPALEDGCDLNYCPGEKVRPLCSAPVCFAVLCFPLPSALFSRFFVHVCSVPYFLVYRLVLCSVW